MHEVDWHDLVAEKAELTEIALAGSLPSRATPATARYVPARKWPIGSGIWAMVAPGGTIGRIGEGLVNDG